MDVLSPAWTCAVFADLGCDLHDVALPNQLIRADLNHDQLEPCFASLARYALGSRASERSDSISRISEASRNWRRRRPIQATGPQKIATIRADQGPMLRPVHS